MIDDTLSAEEQGKLWARAVAADGPEVAEATALVLLQGLETLRAKRIMAAFAHREMVHKQAKQSQPSRRMLEIE
jgi:hypothetical protein